MATTEPTAKEKLKQELRALGADLMSQFVAAKASMKNGDLEALKILAEGKGTCYFKVGDWHDPISLNNTDEQTALLQTFLLLLWQNGSLEKTSYDPLDLRIARTKVSKADNSAQQEEITSGTEETMPENEQKNETKITTAQVEEQAEEEIMNEGSNSTEIPQEVLLAEDGSNYLVGPREINLQRRDHYSPLFSTYRKSTDIRKENFLGSKHLPHVRKLTGIDVNGFGRQFCHAVLERAAPSLEELHVRHAKLDELDIYSNLQFPRLHRLYIWMNEGGNLYDETHFQFPQPLPESVGLRWLCARLPRPALESLLRHNAETLVELQLEVGTPSSHLGYWPMQCADLEVLLTACGLGSGAVRKVHLIRGIGSYHTRAECKLQVEAVRQTLPGVMVVCSKCCISDKSCQVDYSIEYYYPRGAWEEH